MKWKATKISPGGEHTEELNLQQVNELVKSSNFLTMLKRMPIGEKLFYNEINIEFERIE